MEKFYGEEIGSNENFDRMLYSDRKKRIMVREVMSGHVNYCYMIWGSGERVNFTPSKLETYSEPQNLESYLKSERKDVDKKTLFDLLDAIKKAREKRRSGLSIEDEVM